MPRTAAAENRARLRGTLLQTAYLIASGFQHNPDDPFTVAQGTLTSSLEAMGQLPSDQELRGALHYLERLDAIEVTWKRDGSGDWVKLHLCTLGQDLAEGSEERSGVLFSRRRR